jgi:hypothetical protein
MWYMTQSDETQSLCLSAARWLAAPAATLALIPITIWLDPLVPSSYGGNAWDVILPLMTFGLAIAAMLLEAVALGKYIWLVLVRAQILAWWLAILHLAVIIAIVTVIRSLT